MLGKPRRGRRSGITRLVYWAINGLIGFVGQRLDTLLARLERFLGGRRASPEREALLAALNGVLGDYLAASNTPLAMRPACG